MPLAVVVTIFHQLASGEVFGKNQPIALQLLGSQRSREALEGVAMELEDSLYPLLREVSGGCVGGAGVWVLCVGTTRTGWPYVC